MHLITTPVIIPRLLSPWNSVSNHMFIAGRPVLAGFLALYVLLAGEKYRIPAR